MSRKGQLLALVIVLSTLVLVGRGALSDRGDTQRGIPDSAIRGSSPSPAGDVATVFVALNEGLIQAIKAWDTEQVNRFAMPGSPAADRALESIDELRALDVRDEGTYRTLNLRILKETDERAVLIERNQISPCFRNSEGLDVTEGGAVTEQEIKWTLRKLEDEWRLFRARLRSQEVVIRGRDRCA